MIRLTRKYRFSASHRLHSEALGDAENWELYGKCNNPFGHGHDYVLEVTVAGAVDPSAGQVVSVERLDALVHEHVLRGLDHRDLNSEVPEFAEGLVPTSENLAVAVRGRLERHWEGRFPQGPRLEAVRLQETRRNRFELKL